MCIVVCQRWLRCGGGRGERQPLDGAEPTDSAPSAAPRRPCCRLSKSERALWLMLCVNSGLTVAQLVCGAFANSLSLLGDGALMGMDSVCYAVGIFAERRKADRRLAARADRLGALFSTVMLAITTCWVLFDVVDRLIGSEGEEEGARAVGPDGIEVNADVMLIFTAINLVADACVAVACWRFGVGDLIEGVADAAPAASPAAGAELPARGRQATAESPADHKGVENMNVFGAFAHLAADGVRGVAVMLAGILAVAGVVDATKADAYCSLFVCIFVLVAAVGLLRTVLQKTVPTAYDAMDEEEEADADSWPPWPVTAARVPRLPVVAPPPGCSGITAHVATGPAAPANVVGRAAASRHEDAEDSEISELGDAL